MPNANMKLKTCQPPTLAFHGTETARVRNPKRGWIVMTSLGKNFVRIHTLFTQTELKRRFMFVTEANVLAR